MHFGRRILKNLVAFCVFSLLVFSFQNCGSGLQVQSSSSETQNSLTNPGTQPPTGALPNVPINSAGQLVKLKSLGGFNYSGGVCGVDFSDQLVCWGKTSASPTLVPGVTNVVDYVSSANSNCILDKAGKIFCWGYQKPAVVEVVGFGKVVQVTAGNMIICGLNDQAQVFCTGYGIGDTPTEIVGLRGSKKISAGINNICGVTASGELNCNVRITTVVNGVNVNNWSSNIIPGLSDIVDLRSGGGFPVQICALDKNGLLKCFTQASQGSTTPFSNPAPIPGLGMIKMFDVGGGDGGVCAVQVDDKVMCSGSNSKYQIANTSVAIYTDAVLVLSRKVLQIHKTQIGVTCVLNIDNSVQCWGAPSLELGFDQVHIFSEVFAVPQLNGVKQMEYYGEYYIPDVFLLKNDGSVVCRGNGKMYQVIPVNELCPASGDSFVPFHNLQNVKQISGSSNQRMCALFNSGNVTCWGDIDPTTRVSSPDSELGIIPEFQNIVQIATGSGGGLCALTGTGKILCSFMIYNGGGSPYSKPVEYPGVTNVKQIAIGYGVVCALTNDAKVTCLQNDSGKTDLAKVTQVAITDVDQIFSESNWGFYCAIKKDASLVCWNDYDDAQRGVVAFLPKVMSGFTDIKKVYLARKTYVEGEQNYLAQICTIDGSKKIKCQGGNDVGQTSTQVFSTADNLFLGTQFVCAQNAQGTSCRGAKPFRNQADFLGEPIRWPM